MLKNNLYLSVHNAWRAEREEVVTFLSTHRSHGVNSTADLWHVGWVSGGHGKCEIPPHNHNNNYSTRKLIIKEHMLYSNTHMHNIHTCMQAYNHAYTYIHTYIHIYNHWYTYRHLHTCVHAYIHTYIHTYMHRPTVFAILSAPGAVNVFMIY